MVLMAGRLAVVGNKYVVAGTYNEFSNGFLVRLTHSGAVDSDFGPNTPVPHIQTMDGNVEDLFLQPDGKIVVSGGFFHIIAGTGTPPERRAIARFSANGVLDTTFTPVWSRPPEPILSFSPPWPGNPTARSSSSRISLMTICSSVPR